MSSLSLTSLLRGASLAVAAVAMFGARDASAQFSGWATNGSAAVLGGGTQLQLTNGGGGQAGSAYYGGALNLSGISSFTASFRLSLQGTPTQADGIALVLQGDSRGTTALGEGGGWVGYSGTSAITPSVALTFRTWENNSLAIGTNGTIGNVASTGMANLGSRASNIFDVVLTYGGGVLSATATNVENAAELYTVSGAVNLAAIVGQQAYVGFTGGTGAAASDQRILSYSISTAQSTVPEPATVGLLGLGLAAVGGIAARRRRA